MRSGRGKEGKWERGRDGRRKKEQKEEEEGRQSKRKNISKAKALRYLSLCAKLELCRTFLHLFYRVYNS